jgi:outer membrane protein assembly factor BamB
VGVDAKTGKFLWRDARTAGPGANILTPIALGNRVFSSSGQGGGGLVELTAASGGITTREIYFDKALGAGIGGAVVVDGYLYGTTSQVLFCADFATGKVKWSERGVGAASIAYADGRIYLHGHSGDVALIEPTPTGYTEKGRFKQPDRGDRPAWPHPVIANGGLYLRDQGVLLCYDIRATIP